MVTNIALWVHNDYSCRVQRIRKHVNTTNRWFLTFPSRPHTQFIPPCRPVDTTSLLMLLAFNGVSIHWTWPHKTRMYSKSASDLHTASRMHSIPVFKCAKLIEQQQCWIIEGAFNILRWSPERSLSWLRIFMRTSCGVLKSLITLFYRIKFV